LEHVEELYLNSFCFGFRPNSLEILYPLFSQFIFRSENIRNQIVKLAQGSTRYNMSKVQLMKIEIFIPCLEEQNRIAKFLSIIDEKINAVDMQLEQTEGYRKVLVQKLFI